MRPVERSMMLAAFEAGATDRMFWAPRHAYGPDQGFLKRCVFGNISEYEHFNPYIYDDDEALDFG